MSCASWRTLVAQVVFLVVAACVGPDALGQAVDFQAVISGLAEARGKIQSYELTVEASVDDAALPVQTTDGKISTPDKRLTSFTLDVVYDSATKSFLVARRDYFENLTTKKLATEGWRVYAQTPAGVFGGSDGQRRGTLGGLAVEKPSYFDPLGFGLAFPGEFNRGDSWQTLVKNYRSWKGMRLDSDRQGILSFFDGDTEIDIDAQKDYWPTRLRRASNADEHRFESATKLAQVHGKWLPATGLFTTKGRENRLRFNWRSVNSPVEKRLQISDIAARYELQ